MMSDDKPRFYGRRAGKGMSPKKVELTKILLPKVCIPLDDEPLDIKKLFTFAPKELWLEIGFGGGEFLSHQAASHPNFAFIGCEVFKTGIGKMLSHVEKLKLNNLRIFPEDARLLLPRIEKGSVDKTFLLFPDPWPKHRHAERRFIHPDNLKMIASILKNDGEFYVASDNLNYILWTLITVPKTGLFELLTENTKDLTTPPSFWVPTRYEMKAKNLGDVIYYLRFKKNIV